MAKYQNQFLGTSSYSGDILFWNVDMLKPILNFNASLSPLPLQPKKVWWPQGDTLPSPLSLLRAAAAGRPGSPREAEGRWACPGEAELGGWMAVSSGDR